MLFSPALIKFLATRLVATASTYQKILWFVFDLIYVVIISSRIFYLSKLTKLELIIVEHNCVYLSSQNECVFVLNSVLISAGYLDIAPLYTCCTICYTTTMGLARYQFHNIAPIWPILQKGRTTVE